MAISARARLQPRLRIIGTMHHPIRRLAGVALAERSEPAHPFAAIRLPQLPGKPRSVGITSVMDPGLGPAEAADRVAVAGEWIDVVKLGWGTARMTPAAVLRAKVNLYAAAGIAVCSGGTFLEVACAQNRVAEFLAGARELGLGMVEVSNGVHPMSEDEKLQLIGRARAAGLRVWSEVGKKDPE